MLNFLAITHKLVAHSFFFFKKYHISFLFIVGCGFIIYIAFRAFLLSYTYDEALTFLDYVSHKTFIPRYDYTAANNHLLNTWLQILIFYWGGTGEFILRLPNVIAFCFFFYSIVKIVTLLRGKEILIPAFILLLCNPYVIDFFSVGRGYGISIALMTTALYFFLLFFHKPYSWKRAVISITLIFLGCISNMTMVNCFISFLVIILLFCHPSISTSGSVLKRYFNIGSFFLLAMLLLSVCYYHGIRLKKSGALFYGGQEGFWTDTVQSLISATLYTKNLSELNNNILFLTILGIYFCFSIYFFLIVIRNQTVRPGNFMLLFLLLTFFSILTIIQHHFGGTNYLIGRTALPLIPLFTFTLLFFLDELAFFYSKPVTTIAILISIPFGFHFFYCANFHSTFDWRNDSDVKNVFNIAAEEFKHTGDTVSLIISCDGTFVRDIPFFYYQNTYPKTGIKITYSNFLDFTDCSNCFVYAERIAGISCAENVDQVQYFPVSMGYLLHLSKSGKKNITLFSLVNDFDDTTNQFIGKTDKIFYSANYSCCVDTSCPFSQGFIIPLKEEQIGNNYLVTFKSQVYQQVGDNESMMVLSFEREGDLYSWQKLKLERFNIEPGKWASVFFSRFIPENAKPGDIIKAHFWNTGKNVLFVDNIEIAMEKY